MNKKLNKFKLKLLSLGLAVCISLSAFSFSFADSARVVTLGADLTESQRSTILEYFGVNENEVVILEVNNTEEREYLEGIASDSQIGHRTYSCAYVEPTKEGSGLNIKTANVTWVSASMVATTMSTAGMTDANVVIAANFPVSGTGALTGIMKAFEDATGEELDEEKKELATEELVTTGGLAEDEDIGQDIATGVVNDIKTEIIKNDTQDSIQIAETINNVTNNYHITLSDEQFASVLSLMEKIAAQDYNYDEMKDALDGVKDSVSDNLEDLGITVDKSFFEVIGDFFSGIGDWFSDLFTGEDDFGILDTTDDTVLGTDIILDATDEAAINLPTSEEVEGFFSRIWNWFRELFSNDESIDENNLENTQNPSVETEEHEDIENNENNTNETEINNDEISDDVDSLEENSTTYEDFEINDDINPDSSIEEPLENPLEESTDSNEDTSSTETN